VGVTLKKKERDTQRKREGGGERGGEREKDKKL